LSRRDFNRCAKILTGLSQPDYNGFSLDLKHRGVCHALSSAIIHAVSVFAFDELFTDGNGSPTRFNANRVTVSAFSYCDTFEANPHACITNRNIYTTNRNATIAHSNPNAAHTATL
jgi:hypothetical protein